MANAELPPVEGCHLNHDFLALVEQQRGRLRQSLPELLAIEQLYRQADGLFSLNIDANIDVDTLRLPLVSLCLGDIHRSDNHLIITAGIHGVERIGTQVLLAWFESILERCRWDAHWRAQFDRLALVLVPIVNPGGMVRGSRCNPDGIDLNRHAPIDAEGDVPWPIGGQRTWRALPWYRGRRNGPRAAEFVALENIVQRYARRHSTTLALDIHSGFGFQDHLWIPYAYRRQPIEDIASYVALKLLWERNFPHHQYVFGPQAMHYTSHGDIWDYLYRERRRDGVRLLPLTLEMGSWLWVKKHPRQLFSFAGLFNPTVPHRHARVLRGHLVLLDFLLAAARNGDHWRPRGEQEREMEQVAQSMWYRHLK